MLDVFRLLGDDRPLTARDRRDLTRALFCCEVTCWAVTPGDEGISLRANLPRDSICSGPPPATSTAVNILKPQPRRPRRADP